MSKCNKFHNPDLSKKQKDQMFKLNYSLWPLIFFIACEGSTHTIDEQTLLHRDPIRWLSCTCPSTYSSFWLSSLLTSPQQSTISPPPLDLGIRVACALLQHHGLDH